MRLLDISVTLLQNAKGRLHVKEEHVVRAPLPPECSKISPATRRAVPRSTSPDDITPEEVPVVLHSKNQEFPAFSHEKRADYMKKSNVIDLPAGLSFCMGLPPYPRELEDMG